MEEKVMNTPTAYELDSRIKQVVNEVNGLSVVDQESMALATAYTKKIKETIKSIEDYWKEPKQNANKAWKDICSKEKEMAEPLKNLEKGLKEKISDYLIIMEDDKRKKEEELKRLTGMDVVLDIEGGKQKGVSSTDSYEIRVVNESLVPVSFNGVVIRKVDESAIKQLVKLAKGDINIPGIEIEKKKTISVRV